ncbi:MFS transporter [Massilia sp. Root351]|jgi:MFS family permease|uniref:MFS transporter n=1 Tax=Massilia sp. Root351 TaxID=1736522 RepID=UPI00070BC988|nr:MFS transporter [Massilia sp. Root351]KQV82405.1 MFS transporter [Massilia sp. Root351]
MNITTPPLARAAGRALAALSLTTLLSSLGTSIANVALPALALAFDATFQHVQWVVLAYLLAVTTLVVSVGRLGDLVGRRRLLVGGILLFTLASGLCALASELWQLIAARALQGLGAAAMMALSMAFVAASVPKAKTGSAMGLLGAMSAAGTALGPTLGGALLGLAAWPAVFGVTVPLGLLAALLAQRFLPADHPAGAAPRPHFDHLGTLLLALTLAAFATAMTTGRGDFGWLNASLLLCAGAGAVVFVLSQKKARSPLIRLAMFSDAALGAGFVASALVTTVVMATLIVGPFYLGGALALDAGQTGLAMSAGPLVAAVAGFPAGRLVDRLGAHRMSLSGLAAMLAGAAALPLLAARYGVPGYVGPLAMLTAGYALFQAANNTAVMAAACQDQRGVVSGLLNLSRNLGLITGASAMGAVYALGVAASGLPAADPGAVTGGMQAAFGAAAVLILAAFAIVHLGRPLPGAARTGSAG